MFQPDHGRTRICQRFTDLRDKILFALAKLRGIVPSSLFVTGIYKTGKYPVAGGGFADVWKGKILGYSIDVALKILRPTALSNGGNEILRLVSSTTSETYLTHALMIHAITGTDAL